MGRVNKVGRRLPVSPYFKSLQPENQAVLDILPFVKIDLILCILPIVKICAHKNSLYISSTYLHQFKTRNLILTNYYFSPIYLIIFLRSCTEEVKQPT